MIVFSIAVFLFTFKYLQVPPGIETDEGSVAYDAVLVAKTMRDQWGRFLPVFFLSGDQSDWKPPVLIYLTAAFFKVFGASVAVLKLVPVTVTLAAMVVIWLILKTQFENKFALAGLLILITSPIVVIAARTGTNTSYPVLFSAIWLLAMLHFEKSRKSGWLIVGAAALGISIYGYKGMLLLIPPWEVLSIVYIFWLNKFKLNKIFFVQALVFTVTLLPFFGVTPILEQKYPGAIFDRRQVAIESYRHYAYYWLANLGTAFLFVTGDVGKIFSVEKYGAFLLGTLPFFVIGVKKAMEKISFPFFVLAAYVTAPMLFGLAGSEGYGHRLTAMVPPFVVLTTLGLQSIRKSPLRWTLVAFLVFNAMDFLGYYYYRYPNTHETRMAFPNNLESVFKELAQSSKTGGFTPYVESLLYAKHGEGNKFFEAAYFDKPLKLWTLGEKLPENSLLLTNTDRPQFILESP